MCMLTLCVFCVRIVVCIFVIFYVRASFHFLSEAPTRLSKLPHIALGSQHGGDSLGDHLRDCARPGADAGEVR